MNSAGVSLRWHLLGVACILGAVLVFVGRGLLRADEYDRSADAPARPVRQRELLTKRLREAGLDLDPSDERVLRG